MTRKLRTNPRKLASQERSRQTVNTILEATARVLTKEGYDRTSTNKIAAVAGVSIGSLYQYFPSKEALVAAVSEHHSQQVLEMLRRTFAEIAEDPVEVAALAFVSAAIEAHRINPKLHRVLAEEVPRIGRLENVEAITEKVHGLIRAYLDAHRDEIDVPDLDLSVFICVTAVDALTHAAVLRCPDILTDGRAETFVGEVADLVIRYLQR